MMGRPGTPRVLVALMAALATTACAADGSSTGDTSEGLSGELVVFAAASLTESFNQIGDDFRDQHPDLVVTFNFAGSSTLAQQINQGAPADVFASASPANMDQVTEAGNTDGQPIIFARNQLVIAVEAGNPHRVDDLADLADPGLKVALCAEQVPCGAASRTALDIAGVALTPVTFEEDVRATLTKLTLGEVDAALVYRTDLVTVRADVEGIEFPESAAAVNDYPIVVLSQAPNRPAARAFVDFVLSEAGQVVLIADGFQSVS